MNILLTGSTGFLGRSLLPRLLRDDPRRDRKIHLLLRGKDGQSPAQRGAALLRDLGLQSCADRVGFVAGDLRRDRIGLDDVAYRRLSTRLDRIIHLGADTDFSLSLAEARAVNVAGTRGVFDFARQASHANPGQTPVIVDYVSTAYVAGRKRGVVSESELDRGQAFSNNYEASKFEAERLIRDEYADVRTTIYRPSIIVGDSRTGHTSDFKVLYWPLTLLARRRLPLFYCRRGALLDVVPVDFVATAMTAIIRQEALVGQTFHLTAGFGREIRIDQLLDDARRFAGIEPCPIVPYWVFRLLRATPVRHLMPESFWRAAAMAAPYHHYFVGSGVRFDAAASHAALARLGVVPPLWQDYCRAVLEFGRRCRWRRPRTSLQAEEIPQERVVEEGPIGMPQPEVADA